MRGVYLHILADALGSVAVIVSTFLVQQFEWLWADPVISIAVSGLIVASAWPLLIETSSVLLNASPAELRQPLFRALQELQTIPGIIEIRHPNAWLLTSEKLCVSLTAVIQPGAQPPADSAKSLQGLPGWNALLRHRLESLHAHRLQIQVIEQSHPSLQ